MSKPYTKPIQLDPDYGITTEGEIFNLTTGKPLKSRNSRGGYLRIGLHKRFYLVHRLVAFAFLPEPEPHQNEVNHIDFDRTNNCVSNLEWCSSKENKEHAAKHREHYVKSRLSREDIELMQWLYTQGNFQESLARLFDCDQTHVSRICSKNYLKNKSGRHAWEASKDTHRAYRTQQ